MYKQKDVFYKLKFNMYTPFKCVEYKDILGLYGQFYPLNYPIKIHTRGCEIILNLNLFSLTFNLQLQKLNSI